MSIKLTSLHYHMLFTCDVVSILICSELSVDPSGAVCPVADALHCHGAALLHWSQSARVATETVHAADKRRRAGRREQRTGSDAQIALCFLLVYHY